LKAAKGNTHREIFPRCRKSALAETGIAEGEFDVSAAPSG